MTKDDWSICYSMMSHPIVVVVVKKEVIFAFSISAEVEEDMATAMPGPKKIKERKVRSKKN